MTQKGQAVCQDLTEIARLLDLVEGRSGNAVLNAGLLLPFDGD